MQIYTFFGKKISGIKKITNFAAIIICKYNHYETCNFISFDFRRLLA